MPSLDNVVLIDSAVQCCIILQNLGCVVLMPSVFGDLVGYTSIFRAHYGSLENLGEVFAPRKIKFEKEDLFSTQDLFLDPKAGSASLAAEGPQ